MFPFATAGDTGIQVTDPLPPGLSLVTATPSQGSYTSASGLWDVGSLANGATVTLTLTARVVGNLPRTNTATITHADEFDPNLGNNSAGATVVPQEADLALTKSVNDPRPNVGETVTFTVSLINHGPNAATNVTFADSLPAGFALVSATPSQGSCAGGIWTVGTISPSATQTLTITATVVSPAAQTNTASITHSDQFDPVPGNNIASATVAALHADVAVTKTVDNPSPMFGTPVVYTITVTNHGPDAASNVIVADPLPAGLILFASLPSQGAFDGASGVWSVGTLGNGVTAVLHLAAQTVMDGPIVNHAVVQAGQFDPDLSNNQANAIVTVQPTPEQIGKGLFLGSSILGNPPVDPALFPQNARFVSQLYGDLLHRQADAIGLAYWSDALDNGASRLQVVQAIQRGPEYLGNEVNEVYSHLLHRAADPGGSSAFIQYLENGGTLEQVEALIAGSPEYFQRRGGGTNDGFLSALFQDGLVRAVEPATRTSGDLALASGVSRTLMALQVFNSPEYDMDLVEQDYLGYLRRPADPAGLNGWAAQLLGGIGADQVLANILASDEYFTQIA